MLYIVRAKNKDGGQLKFKMASFDRAKEPKNVKQKEGSSLEWGTHKAITDCGYVPDIIYDLGGQGKDRARSEKPARVEDGRLREARKAAH